jgi:hypothetical protein
MQYMTTQCSKRFEHKTKSVAYLLNENQRQNQLSVCNDLQHISKKNRYFLYQAVTVYKSWVYGYDAETITSQISKPYHRQYWIAQKSVPEMLSVEEIRGLV